MNLRSQRRIAAEILDSGINRIRMDPERLDEIESSITREEIRKLISEKAISSLPKRGVSKGRARVIHNKKKKGLRSGFGSRKGTAKARSPTKRIWIRKVRSLRNRLRELKSKYAITDKDYRKLYVLSGSGRFDSIKDLESHIKSNNLWRRR